MRVEVILKSTRDKVTRSYLDDTLKIVLTLENDQKIIMTLDKVATTQLWIGGTRVTTTVIIVSQLQAVCLMTTIIVATTLTRLDCDCNSLRWCRAIRRTTQPVSRFVVTVIVTGGRWAVVMYSGTMTDSSIETQIGGTQAEAKTGMVGI
jgi:hypothetical protein